MDDDERGTQSAKARKLRLRADEIGLDRDERIAIAEMLLRRDFTSWSQLDEGQVDRMLDALEGFQLIVELARQRTR